MSIKKELDRLTRTGTKRTELPAANARDGIGASVNEGGASSGGSGGGISSPLTETSRETTPKTITDPTGAFVVTVDVVTKLTLTDASGGTVVLNFKAPA